MKTRKRSVKGGVIPNMLFDNTTYTLNEVGQVIREIIAPRGLSPNRQRFLEEAAVKYGWLWVLANHSMGNGLHVSNPPPPILEGQRYPPELLNNHYLNVAQCREIRRTRSGQYEHPFMNDMVEVGSPQHARILKECARIDGFQESGDIAQNIDMSDAQKLPENIKTKLHTLAQTVRERQKAYDTRYPWRSDECEPLQRKPSFKPQYESWSATFPRLKSVSFVTQTPKWKTEEVVIKNHFNNVTLPFLKRNGLMHEFDKFKKDWFDAQCNYIKNLPIYDLLTTRVYTYYGDELANNMMRNKVDKYSEENPSWSVQILQPQVVTWFHTLKPSECIDFDNKDVQDAIALSRKVSDNTATQDDRDKLFNNIPYKLLRTSFSKRMIRQFIKDMQRIILAAPKIPSEMVLYRGVKSPFYQLKSHKGNYKNEGFVSTSLNIDAAAMFLADEPEALQDDDLFSSSDDNDTSSSSGGAKNKGRKRFGKCKRVGGTETSLCCMQRLKVLSKTSALLLLPISQVNNEFEIVLPVGMTFVLHNGRKNMYRQIDPHDTCYANGYFVQVTDATVSPVVRAELPSSPSGSASKNAI